MVACFYIVFSKMYQLFYSVILPLSSVDQCERFSFHIFHMGSSLTFEYFYFSLFKAKYTFPLRIQREFQE
jgi:hypothetical protein